MKKAILLLLISIAGALGACGGDTKTVTAAVVVDVPKPPIPRECKHEGRAIFPKVKSTPGNKTPVSALEHAFIAAKKRDADNAAREHLCLENIRPQFAPEAPIPPVAEKKVS